MRFIKNCIIIGSCLSALNLAAITSLPTKGYLNAQNETPKGICGSDQSWVKFGSTTSKVKATGKVVCAGDKSVKMRYELFPGDIHYMWGLESDKSVILNKCQDPGIQISLKDYMNFTPNNSARYEGQFKIPRYVQTDMTIFQIVPDNDPLNPLLSIFFDAETRNIQVGKNASDKNSPVVKAAIKDDRWYNLTVLHAKNSGKINIYFNGVLFEPPKNTASVWSQLLGFLNQTVASIVTPPKDSPKVTAVNNTKPSNATNPKAPSKPNTTIPATQSKLNKTILTNN